MGEREFKQIKSNAYFIYSSRGKSVYKVALVKALFEKRITGSGLDIFEKETADKDIPWLKMHNAIALPHFASYSDVHSVRTAKYKYSEGRLQGLLAES